jgi:hypothetical protein
MPADIVSPSGPPQQPYNGDGIYSDSGTRGQQSSTTRVATDATSATGTGGTTGGRENRGTNASSEPPSNNPARDNISSLANPNTIKILGTSIQPKAFGQQLLNQSVQKTIAAVRQDKLFKLYEERANLIKEGIELEVKHKLTLEKLEQQYRPRKQVDTNPTSATYGRIVEVPPKLTKEQYEKLVAIESGGEVYTNPDPSSRLTTFKMGGFDENGKLKPPIEVEPDKIVYEGNYPTAKKSLEARKAKNQKDIDDLKADREEARKKRKTDRAAKKAARKAKTKEQRKEAIKQRVNSILKDAKKTLPPIVITLAVGQVEKIIAQNAKIKKLVDETNKIIESANLSNDPVKLKDATIRRDNAIRVIESNERNIQQILKQIETLNLYINIFQGIVNVITAIPIPTAVPPGIGIPINVIMRLVQILFRISQLLSILSAYIPDVQTSLNNVISILNGHKAQLLNINGIIENAASSSISNGTTTPSNVANVNYGPADQLYKGFKFVIRKEAETTPTGGRETRGERLGPGVLRHYAVAINRAGIEVLKSELSFTLDTNDLIEQLKIIIDQRGLQG